METQTNSIKYKYDRLVIAIPHSHPHSGQVQWECNKETKAFRDRFTDWYTDELFDAESDSITVVKGDISRLDCDLERLEHEFDRLCNFINIRKNGTESMPYTGSYRNYCLSKWYKYRADILEAANADRPLIIDSHSFPCDIAPSIDICIGFNDDTSCPPGHIINAVRQVFETAGYNVAFNKPFANALAPIGYAGHSLMIEVNKKTYMDESAIQKNKEFNRLHKTILNVYRIMLGQ